MKTSIAICGAALGLVLSTSPAWAWGNDGHRIVCQIAFDRLTPAGRALVKTIAADLSQVGDPFGDCPACQASHPDDGRFLTFQEGCTWADESRRDTYKDTYEYHYINLPKGSKGVELIRDCAAIDCALVGIQRNARYLVVAPLGVREKERRVLALRFLGHFVGDLHQPLHVGFIEDAGGNAITVHWNTGAATVTDKLHAVWDSLILARAGLQQQDGHALNLQITPAEAAAWETFDIVAWAGESFTAATTHAYVQPGGAEVIAGTTLSDPYFNDARPVVIEQLKKAGVRLAHLINAAAAGTLPSNLLQVAVP